MFKVKMLLLTVLLPSMLRGGFRRSICKDKETDPDGCQNQIEADIIHCRAQLPTIDSNISAADLRAQLREFYDLLAVDDREGSVQIIMRKIIEYSFENIEDGELSQDKRSLFAWAASLLFLGDLDKEGKTLKLNKICQDAFAAIQLGLIADDLPLEKDKQGFVMMLGLLARAGDLLTIVVNKDVERRKTMAANILDLPYHDDLEIIFDKDPNHEKEWDFAQAKKIHKELIRIVYQRFFEEELMEEGDSWIKYGLTPALDAMWSSRIPRALEKLAKTMNDQFQDLWTDENKATSAAIYNDDEDMRFARDINFMENSYKTANKYYGNILSLIRVLPVTAHHADLFTFKTNAFVSFVSFGELRRPMHQSSFLNFCKAEDPGSKARRAIRLLFLKLEETAKFGFYLFQNHIKTSGFNDNGYFTSADAFYATYEDKFSLSDYFKSKYKESLDANDTANKNEFKKKFKKMSENTSKMVCLYNNDNAYTNIVTNDTINAYLDQVKQKYCSNERLVV